MSGSGPSAEWPTTTLHQAYLLKSVILLNLKARALEFQRAGVREKPEKWTFLSLAFCNPPSSHTHTVEICCGMLHERR